MFRKRRREPGILLDNRSPYGHRSLAVEYDGQVTAAYLLRDDEPYASCWLANHVPAPESVAREVGHGALMPADATRYPQGSEPFSDLSAVWFEDAAGVAVLAGSEPVALLVDEGAEFRGYSRDALRRTDLAWPLSEGLERVGDELTVSVEHWRWLARSGAWRRHVDDVHRHLSTRLGSPGRPLELTERPNPRVTARAFGYGGVNVVSTLGMSAQRITAASPAGPRRVELVLGSRAADDERDRRVLSRLARQPWIERMPFGPGAAVAAPMSPEYTGGLLVSDSSRLADPTVPDLAGLSFRGDPVTFLWLLPLTREELSNYRTEGKEAPLRRLAGEHRDWVLPG